VQEITFSRVELKKDFAMNFPCPNCGQLFTAKPTDVRLLCPGCGEELVWSADGKKMLLAHPLPNYLDTGSEAHRISQIWDKADQMEPLIDFRRRQSTVEQSAKWLDQRITSENRNFRIGGVLVFVCAVLIMIALIRFLLLGYIQLDAFLPFIGASFLAPFGFFFLIWAVVERMSLSKFAKRVREERRLLKEEEKAYKY
jgi:predicted RNA-binding Zn-ribbon protein involved in translation (DUF1610 family)